MKQFLSILLSLLILTGCSSNPDKKKVNTNRITTDSAPYELLVIGDKEWLKTSDGSMVTDVVNSYILGLPQQERNFKTVFINPSAFGKTFQGFSNIMVLDMGSKYTKPAFRIVYDVYAHPQTVVYCTAPNGKALAELVSKRQAQIIDLYVNTELKREQINLRKIYSNEVRRQVKKQFGYDIYVPKELDAVKTGKDFMWASSDQIGNRLNICIYSYPFTAEEDFSKERFIAKRDSFMRENIKGEKEGQYMSTNTDFVFTRSMMLNGHYVLEARGLWEMKNDMMGGPFVSYTQVDTIQNRVIVAEGFVYAPEKKKRPFIRRLEAAIQTLKNIQ